MYLREEVIMLKKEDFAVIKALNEMGVYQKDIGEKVGVHPKTVSRALKRGSVPGKARQVKTSKLDPYKATIDQLLKEGVWNAVVILREIQTDGYDGEISLVRKYIQPKRVMRSSRATVRFETRPGQQMQSDWGEIVTQVGGKSVKVRFIVNELGYSRRFHFWCTTSLDAEHTYEGIIRSLEYFGGVTEEVLVDNQKSAVLQASNQGATRFNERFLDLADQYGFTPRACRPYRARTKGKDERMVGYIKQHFFVRYRSFESWAHLNQLAERWLAEEADQRVQGTVKEVVAVRFAREYPLLKSLPLQRYDTSYLEYRKAGWDGYIHVRGNRYSVPIQLAGQTLLLRIGLDDEIRVYHAEKLVAKHCLRSAEEGWATTPEHHAALWQSTLTVEKRPLETYEEAAQWS
jgi:transposase